MKKHSPICPECALGWLEEIRLDGKLWLKCRSCGFMKRLLVFTRRLHERSIRRSKPR